jgi:single-strand DNA-binding protein
MVLNQEIEEEFNMNKTVLIGRLTKDPELKFTPGNGTAVATFTLAVDRRALDKNKEKQADYIPIVVWGKQAESVAPMLKKGAPAFVEGRLQTRSWEGQDGVKRYKTEIVSDNIIVLGGKGAGVNSNPMEQISQTNNSSNEEIDIEDIPF